MVLDLKQIIAKNIDTIINLRKELSKNAEISFKEYKTKAIIKDFLNSINIETKDCMETGLLGILNTDRECIAVRADMDALPLKDRVFHACGHDYHMAIALGVALVLKELNYKKCVKFIFQPGEEDIGGAVPMIKEGALNRPKVTKMIGLHVWPELSVGSIEVSPGASMGSIDDFHITFKGKGGHAAIPFKCKNPIYPAIDFIEAINIKSKTNFNPQNPHVLTVSSIQSGKVPNVIENDAKVLGTVRTFDSNLRKEIQDQIIKLAKLSAEKYDCQVEIYYDNQYPPLVSDKALTEDFIQITKTLLGEDKILPLEKTFAGEDFAYFCEQIPCIHFRLGISEGDKGNSPLHAPDFSASEEALFYGIYVITNYILSQ